MPLTIGLDNEPAFVAKTVQQVARALKTQWKFRLFTVPRVQGKKNA